MTLLLRITASPTVPLEVEGIVPEKLATLSNDEIEQLTIFHGNEKVKLGDFFDVSGSADDEQLRWEGDLGDVHWIGAKMGRGSITIEGAGGRHIGSEMSGGEIQVLGNAGDWVGGEMHGGLIHVHGDAGHLIGAAYRGSAKGMDGGTIFIDGRVGNEVGHTMRRGMLVVGGDCGDLAGFNMLAGSILILGNAGIRHGAGMRRGTLGFWGPERPPLLPSFKHACRFRPPMLSLIYRQLSAQGFELDQDLVKQEFDLFHGDLIEGGRGEVLMPCVD